VSDFDPDNNVVFSMREVASLIFYLIELLTATSDTGIFSPTLVGACHQKIKEFIPFTEAGFERLARKGTHP
jgi:hypothetical protein